MRVKDRFFVVESYKTKWGPCSDAIEWSTHERATISAFAIYSEVAQLSGPIVGEVAVFVGSKLALKRAYGEHLRIHPGLLA